MTELFENLAPEGHQPDNVSAGTVFFLMQTARSSRDGHAEIVRALERQGARGSAMHAQAVAAMNQSEVLRAELAVQYELRARMEKKKRTR